MISDKILGDLHSAIKIEEVIGSYIVLTKKGNRLWGCCPFHKEKTPSFLVSSEKNTFKCFGCSENGDAISFIQKYEGVNFTEAVGILAKKYNIEIEESQFSKSIEDQLYDRIAIILRMAADFYKNLLFNSEEGRELGLKYFKSRGISSEAIDLYELGYSLDLWEALYRHVKNLGFDEKILEQSGLFIVKEDSVYDRFRGRVIFPIHSPTGKIISFGARIIEKDPNQPKYINSPETVIFQKRNTLYGLFQAKNIIRKLDKCFLVEGYTDVIAMYDSGIQNTIASMGTALTPEQINILSRHTKNITILFDGDSAGVKASLRGIDIILHQGMYVKVVPLPENEDPQSFAISLGSEEMKNYISENEQDFIEFKAKALLKDAQEDTMQVTSAIQSIIESLASIPDSVYRVLLTKKCSKIFNIDENVLLTEQSKISQAFTNKLNIVKNRSEKQYKNQKLTVDSQKNFVFDKESTCKKILLKMILDCDNETKPNTELIDYIFNELSDIELSLCVYTRIFNLIQNKYRETGSISSYELIHNEDEEIKKNVIDLLMNDYETSEIWGKNKIVLEKVETLSIKNAKYVITTLKLTLIENMLLTNLKIIETATDQDQEEKALFVHSELKIIESTLKSELMRIF